MSRVALKPDTAMPSLPATVYIVDDDASFLKAVSRLLRAGGYAVQTFTSAADFLAALPPQATGCVVVDLQMPGQSGRDLQSVLAAADNPMPVIFLTGHGDIPTGVHAMRDGAVDFLTKPVKKENLIAAVERALARDAVERAQRSSIRALRDRFDQMTPREREVLVYVISGKLNKQIAFDLGASERTIKAHRARIMEKLNAQSVAELVRITEQLGIEPLRSDR
ncbi:MAG: response regulator transcription factor [Candidatus Binatia bacterium]